MGVPGDSASVAGRRVADVDRSGRWATGASGVRTVVGSGWLGAGRRRAGWRRGRRASVASLSFFFCGFVHSVSRHVDIIPSHPLATSYIAICFEHTRGDANHGPWESSEGVQCTSAPHGPGFWLAAGPLSSLFDFPPLSVIDTTPAATPPRPHISYLSSSRRPRTPPESTRRGEQRDPSRDQPCARAMPAQLDTPYYGDERLVIAIDVGNSFCAWSRLSPVSPRRPGLTPRSHYSFR